MDAPALGGKAHAIFRFFLISLPAFAIRQDARLLSGRLVRPMRERGFHPIAHRKDPL
jgi:hypothetical protein